MRFLFIFFFVGWVGLFGLEPLVVEGVAGAEVLVKGDVYVAGVAQGGRLLSGFDGDESLAVGEFCKVISQGDRKVWVWVLGVSSLKSDELFWMDEGTSMGDVSLARLPSWVSSFLLLQPIESMNGGVKGNLAGVEFKRDPSLLSGLFGGEAHLGLEAGVRALSGLVLEFVGVEFRDKVGVDRPYFSRSFSVDSFTWGEEFFFLVDSTPFSAPERAMTLVVVRCLTSE